MPERNVQDAMTSRLPWCRLFRSSFVPNHQGFAPTRASITLFRVRCSRGVRCSQGFPRAQTASIRTEAEITLTQGRR
jgi:hypothetical protein